MVSKSYVINKQLTSLIFAKNNSWKLSNARKGLGSSFLVVLDEQIGLVRLDQGHLSPTSISRIPDIFTAKEEFLMSADAVHFPQRASGDI